MYSLANQAPVKSELMKQVPKFSVWLSVGIEGNQKVNQEHVFFQWNNESIQLCLYFPSVKWF